MANYLPQPMIAGNLLAVWDILKRGLEARGIKDWQNILPPKEAILKEMKMMQVQQQVQERQAQQPSVEQVAAQKLEQQGVPREEAARMVIDRVKEREKAQL